MEIFVLINFLLTLYLFTQVSSLKQESLESPSEDESLKISLDQLSNTPKIPRPPQPTVEPHQFDIFSRGVLWIRENWMLKLGGLFILMAVGWFLTYAFMNNWIGEMGRIVLGISGGCAFMLWGILRMKKVMTEGEVPLVIGSIILVTSVFAGQHAYALYPEFVSLSLMTFVSIVVATISYIHKREVIAVYAVLMIGLCPTLAGFESQVPNIPGLLTYLLCMIMGVVWLSKITGWRSIVFLVTLVVFFYVAPHFYNYYEYVSYQRDYPTFYKISRQFQKSLVDIDILRFFAVVYSVVLNSSAFLTLLHERKAAKEDAILVASAASFAAFSLFMLSTADLLGLKLAGMALLYILLSVVLTRITAMTYYIQLYATVSIFFLVAATLKTAHADFLPTFLSIEAIALTLFYRWNFNTPYPISSIVLYGGSFVLTFTGISELGMTWQSVVSFVSTVISTYFPYFLETRSQTDSKKRKYTTIEKLSLFAGNILSTFGFYFLIENVLDAFDVTTPFMKGVRYTFFAVFGTVFYFVSSRIKQGMKYYFGIGYIIYVVGSLLLFEVWMMGITTRIIVFFLIGVLFISSIYFLKKYEKK